MTQGDTRPTKLEVTPDGLHIVWPDGFETLMPHRYVRGNCSCAVCVDEITHVRHTGVDDVPTDVEIVEYLDECRKMDIELLPPDINCSQSEFSVEERKIRYGLSAVKGMGEKLVESIIAARADGEEYASIFDLCERACRALLSTLIERHQLRP